MKLLSIITPYYNTYEYLKKISDVLRPQLTDEVEWIIIDDGCHDRRINEFATIPIHLLYNSGNASRPRNFGLDLATGEYIVFIDSDDMIAPNYVETILNKIKAEDFDYCYFGWKTKKIEFMIEREPEEWNCSVCNCIYKKSLIGETRFDENRNIGEDRDFNERVRKGKRSNIKEILYQYFYREREGSLSKQYRDKIIKAKKEG